jgi:hypothetical protein
VRYLRNLVAAFIRHPEADKISTFPDWTGLRNRLIFKWPHTLNQEVKPARNASDWTVWKQAAAEQDYTGPGLRKISGSFSKRKRAAFKQETRDD